MGQASPRMTQTMFLEKPPKTEECLANVIIWPHTLPSGKRLHSYWKWPFIVDLPIKMVIFHSYVSLPEGNNLNNCFPNEGNLLVDMVSTTSSEPPRATDRGILEYYRRTCFFLRYFEHLHRGNCSWYWYIADCWVQTSFVVDLTWYNDVQ